MKEIILSRMTEAGITRYRLSQLTGISQSALSRWFAGKRDLSSGRVQLIMDALGIKVH